MELFQEKAPQLLKTGEAKRIIRNYNKLAKVLLEFEVLYHREWIRQINTIRAGMLVVRLNLRILNITFSLLNFFCF